MAFAKSDDPARCEMELEVAADCPLGLYGLRLATEDGLSNLQLFLVDDIAVRTRPTEPQQQFPVAYAGVFRAAEVDRYPVQMQAGQRLSIDIVASRFGTDADPLVTIYNASGRKVAQHDNDPGLFFDVCFEHEFKEAGNYWIEVRDSRHQGATSWQYILRLGSFPTTKVALPSSVKPGETVALRLPELGTGSTSIAVPNDQQLGGMFHAFRRPGDNASNWVPLAATKLTSIVETEPNNTFDQATVATTPIALHGNLEKSRDQDWYAFDMKKGERLFIRAETRLLGSAADVELMIANPEGKEMQRVDDQQLPGGALDEGTITLNADKDARFYVAVREATGAFGPELTYRLEVQPAGPRFSLTAEHSAFTIPQDSYQSLPLSVVRTDYNGPIELTLVDAPAGLKLEPTTIPENANSAICKLIAPPELAQGLYTFSLLATAKVGDAQIEAKMTTQPLVDKQLINVDLIKHALRDNQRWLPSSTKDRLALQITPPSAFAVEPAEKVVTLPRYQQVGLAMQTARKPGFESPIAFHAVGTGQLGEEAEGRRQVFSRFPKSEGTSSAIEGSFHSRSQANEQIERVDISAEGKDGQRSIKFVRSIMLQVKPAYELDMEPKLLTLAPGTTEKIKLTAKRLPSFDGEVTISPTTFSGVTVPKTLKIPAGQTSAECEIVVAADAQPRRDRVRFPSFAQVGVFQEEPRQLELDLEVKIPAPPK